MEPLDVNLVKKFAPIVKREIDSEFLYLRKTVQERKFSESSVEREVQLLVSLAHRKRKWTDKADYKLSAYALSVIHNATGFTLGKMQISGQRYLSLAVARALYAFIERKLNKRSLSEIAAILKKHHTSIMYMVDAVENQYKGGVVMNTFLSDRKMKYLYDCAIKGEWSWEKALDM